MSRSVLRVLRHLVAFVVRRGYRFRVHGVGNVPSTAPAVLVANHVSFIDSLLLAAAVQRPMRFVMSHQYFENRWLQPFFRAVRAIPICPSTHSVEMKEHAFEAVAAALHDGELVCVFPEGRITKDGSMNEFRPGIERIVRETPVDVVPVGIRGQWGSRFSRQGPVGARAPGRGRAEVSICFGAPVSSQSVSAELLAGAVSALAEPSRPAATPRPQVPEVLPPSDMSGEVLVLAS